MDDIRRQVMIAVRWLPLAIVGALAAGAIAYALTSGQPKIYEASARLIVDPGPSPTTQDLAVAQDQLLLYAGLADSGPIAEAVIERLDLDIPPEVLLGRISTSTDAESLSLFVDARGGDPEAARQLADAVGEETRLRVRERLITDEVRDADRAIKANQAAIAFSQRRLNSLIAKPNKTPQDRIDVQSLFSQISSLQADIIQLQPSSSAFVRNRVNWFERPGVPSSPVEPRPMYWTLLALVVGGMVGLAIGFVIEYLVGKVRDDRDLEAVTGSEVLGSVTEKRGDVRRGATERLVVLRHPTSVEADAYRSLRARISLASGSARTLLVASADGADGKSAVAANLAIAYAEAGSTVILADADQRSPRLHTFFGVPNDRGLSMLLRDGEAALDHMTVPTPHPRLRLLPAGPASLQASELLGSPQLPRQLGRLLQVSDMVVFDSPSLAANLDAAMLARHLQASILVVPRGSRGKPAADAANVLDSGEGRFAGAVLYRTARGSHGRSTVPMPVRLPSPQVALPSQRSSPVATQPAGVPTHTADQQPSEPTTTQPSQPTNAPTYLLEAFLYRIIRGPHARAVTKPETSSVTADDRAAGMAKAVPATANGATRAPAPQLPAGAPAVPWPDQPRAPIVVPIEPPAGVSAPPAAGPYSGGFKPGGGS